MATPTAAKPALAPIAVTIGEPAGIGPEIIAKAWAARKAHNLPPFFVCGSERAFPDTPTVHIDAPQDAVGAFAAHLPVSTVLFHDFAVAGKPDPKHGPAVIEALARATDFCIAGHAAALVTAPFQKSTLYGAGFAFPGHTEYLEARFQDRAAPPESLMLLEGGGLRVALVTIHLPMKDVPAALTQDAILRKGTILSDGLKQDFGIAAPRIAVAALNPHGGEDGALGREEIDIIAPAVSKLRERRIDAQGPFPADTLFHEGARSRYDAVLCMYHDQALIPLKTLDFKTGVNITLGLPIVRTSPDHGTALDIAGKGVADPSSLIAAIKTAAAIAARRASAK